ncbi:uncharacterized protein [Littorina saxatilis]|uniref:uncharacterized protein isoform X2 n=1 Tax=Littorina saxatilis TaxID=31220 RepID=UPI0038B60257
MIHLQILLQIVFFTRSVSAITMRGCEQGDLKLLKNEFATDLECNLSGRNDSTVTWSLIDENGEHATIGTCSNGSNCFVSADLSCKISRSEHSTKLHVDVVEDWMNGKLMCAESASEFTESANCSVRVVSVKMANCHAAKEHSDVIVDCISQHHSPSHISLTLTPKTGHTINIANCENVTRFMKCTPELGGGTTGPMTCDNQTTWTPRHLYALIPRVNRTMAGTLECTYTHNGTTESDSCELDVVEPAQVEGCQVDISHSNWSAIVRCDVSQAYSSTQHYSFSATLHRKGTLAHRPVFEGRRVFSLLEEFVNRTNNLSYYRGQFAFSTPLSSTPGNYSFRVIVYTGMENIYPTDHCGYNVSSAKREPVHAVETFVEELNINAETTASPSESGYMTTRLWAMTGAMVVLGVIIVSLLVLLLVTARRGRLPSCHRSRNLRNTRQEGEEDLHVYEDVDGLRNKCSLFTLDCARMNNSYDNSNTIGRTNNNSKDNKMNTTTNNNGSNSIRSITTATTAVATINTTTNDNNNGRNMNNNKDNRKNSTTNTTTNGSNNDRSITTSAAITTTNNINTNNSSQRSNKADHCQPLVVLNPAFVHSSPTGVFGNARGTMEGNMTVREEAVTMTGPNGCADRPRRCLGGTSLYLHPVNNY